MSTSTITDRLARLGAFVANAVLLLAAWFALVLIATPLLPPGLPVAALLPSSATLVELPKDARILDWQPGRAHLISDRQGLALELYRRGAWLVMPLGNASCLGIDRAASDHGSAKRLAGMTDRGGE